MFVANMANRTLDIIDLKEGKLHKSVPDQKGIQGVTYSPNLDRPVTDGLELDPPRAYGPKLAYHPKEGGRVEFESYDMPTDRRDLAPFFLLWLWLMDDTKGSGRASDKDRIYDLGSLARAGWEAEEIASRAEEALDRAERTVTGSTWTRRRLAGCETAFASGRHLLMP